VSLVTVIIIAFLIAFGGAQVVRTTQDRRTRQDQGRDIGPPWSGSCVSIRSLDLQIAQTGALTLAERSIRAAKGSAIVVDQAAWSASGWTGTHLGAYGSLHIASLLSGRGWALPMPTTGSSDGPLGALRGHSPEDSSQRMRFLTQLP